MTTSNKAQMIRLQFMKKLVARHKEGTIITLTEMNEVRDQFGFEKFKNALIFIRKSGLYKVARNQYLVTLSKDPISEIYRISKGIKTPKSNVLQYKGKNKKRLVHIKRRVPKASQIFLTYYANEKKHSARAN